MKITPQRDIVLLRRAKSEEKTDSGLFIPSAAQETSNLAEVLAVGPGRMLDSGRLVKPSVRQGDIVLIGKWEGEKVVMKDEELLLVQETNILAVVEPLPEIRR